MLSVYLNVGYLFDAMGDPARSGEILRTEGIPLTAELGLPTMAEHVAAYCAAAGRSDATRAPT